MENFELVKKDDLSQLPKDTGVYCFLAGRKILYIGKATSIKERVKNHFYQPNYRDDLFIGQTEKIGYVKTGSEIEALLLEADLIKKYQPRYNIAWRDDKNYFYVEITDEEYPRVLIVHQRKEKADYIGPFVEGKSLKRALTYLRKTFPYYTARRHPQGSCLWCSLKLCPGPNPSKDEYQKDIKNLISVLRGKSQKVLTNLKKEMKNASARKDYERAGKIRDQIYVLERTIEHARVLEPADLSTREMPKEWQFKRSEAYDISNIQGQEATGSMVVFTDERPDKSQYRKFKVRIAGKPDDVAMIKEVLERRLKHEEWPYPDLILIDGGKAQLNAAKTIAGRHKFEVKIMAIAKKNNELFVENRKKPLLLKDLPRPVFNLILQLRDEAHRFAISYHKKLRKKGLLG